MKQVPSLAPDFLQPRVVERKIGRATFIVSTRFNNGKEKDIVSIMSRLICGDSGK